MANDQTAASWLGLAPRNDRSGWNVVRSRTRKTVHRATHAFRPAAQSVAGSDTVEEAYVRRTRAKLGPHQATVATAHTIARVVDRLLKNHDAVAEITGAD